MLIAIAVALLLADLLTTLVGVRIAGPDAEDNTLWRRLMRRHGLAAFCIAYLAVMAAVVFAASLAGDSALAGFVAVLALVVSSNLHQLWKLTSRRKRAARPRA